MLSGYFSLCCLLFFVHSACLGRRLELLRPVLRPIDPDPPRHPRRLQQPPDASICASSCCYCRALRLPATVLFCRWRLPQVLASRITASCCQDARRNRDRAYLTWPSRTFPIHRRRPSSPLHSDTSKTRHTSEHGTVRILLGLHRRSRNKPGWAWQARRTFNHPVPATPPNIGRVTSPLPKAGSAPIHKDSTVPHRRAPRLLRAELPA